MTWILYYSPGACSQAVHIILHELGRPFEARRVVVAEGEHLRPDYLAINPRGRVPTLVVNGRPIGEVSGLLTWLGQQGDGLFPPAGTVAAASCGEWLAWLTSGVHTSFAMIWRGERFSHDPALHPAIRARGFDWLDDQFAEIDGHLAGRDWVLDDYGVVDANLLPFYRWGLKVGYDMRARFPAWTAHTERMLLRPAVIRTLQAEGLSFWVERDPAFTPRASRAA